MLAVGADVPVPIREALAWFPEDTRPSYATICRWCSEGVRGKRLRAQWVGGRLYVTRQALDRFLAELNAV